MYKLINTLKTQNDAIPTMMDYGPSAELGDVSSKYSCLPITLYIEHVGQVMQTQEAVRLAEVYQYMTISQIMQLCLATVPCQWSSEDGSKACGAEISCISVPIHLRDKHGIRKFSEDTLIDC